MGEETQASFVNQGRLTRGRGFDTKVFLVLTALYMF
jgi:hypothetical protein